MHNRLVRTMHIKLRTAHKIAPTKVFLSILNNILIDNVIIPNQLSGVKGTHVNDPSTLVDFWRSSKSIVSLLFDEACKVLLVYPAYPQNRLE